MDRGTQGHNMSTRAAREVLCCQRHLVERVADSERCARRTLCVLSPRDLEELLDVGDLGRHFGGCDLVCLGIGEVASLSQDVWQQQQSP